ncbi:GRAS family protein RAM1-like [Phoenix dactylifera]|uniref:GRAS family protein RAM1-like n=1 Tax=Phoenix dactylifera TaxID=42345 RepID=A0A8B7BS62_PHODC|nr:GRAS family protein RAM1-like [Phoenix dactylifera]
MQEDIGEEMPGLDLGIGSTWCSSTAEKRKQRRGESNSMACGTLMQDVLDKKFFGLLQARERMLRADPRRNGLEDGNRLQLTHLLLVAATAADANDISSAVDALHELYDRVSLHGDPIQRVAAYFIDGLAARLLTGRSPFYRTIMAHPTPEEEFSAFTQLYQASPYYQFAHFTANQAIIEAFEKEEMKNGRRLHVVDFDVSYGFQWPSLIQSLSDKATGSKPISLRIMGFGRSIEELKETETRLANFTKGCRNLIFEFEGLLTGSKSSDFKIEKDATLVVNLVFYLQNLRSSSEVYDTLMAIHSLNPSVVVLVGKEGSQSPQSFLSRFTESLHYYAAMFDSLNDCLPSGSVERLSIEKNHLGREIKTAMTNEEKEEEKHLMSERLDTWKRKMESFGFEEIKLSSTSVSQAKLLLKIKSHCSSLGHDGGAGGFRISERDEGRAISLGWQDRLLTTVSAWHCIRSPNHSPGCSL